MKKPLPPDEQIALLLKHLVAIELWRGGLSQAQIRKRLGLSMGTVSDMLKGVEKYVTVRTENPEN